MRVESSAAERDRVAKGAKLMDRILPGWHRMVDLNTLSMYDGTQCLLGQTFGVHAEKCLAKEMYPEEWKESLRAAEATFTQPMHRYGYAIAVGHGGGHMIEHVMRRLGLDPVNSSEYYALRQVCSGHDNRCVWAEEIANRLAQDVVQHEEAVNEIPIRA